MNNLPNCTFTKETNGVYVLKGPHNRIAEFCMDVDGHWYVWFSKETLGGFNDLFFHWCYLKLKELNKPMDDSVEEYFNSIEHESASEEGTTDAD